MTEDMIPKKQVLNLKNIFLTKHFMIEIRISLMGKRKLDMDHQGDPPHKDPCVPP